MTKYVNNNGVSEMWTNTKNYISAQLLGKSDVGHTHSASDITSGLATVATSGNYNDLSNKPTIPSKTSDLTNDSGFITSDNTKIPLAGSNQISGSLIPATTNAYDLGGSSYQWNNAYIKSLTINGVACGDILTHNVSEFVPVSGGAVMTGNALSRTIDNNELRLDGGTGWGGGASIVLGGKNKANNAGAIYLHAEDSTSYNRLEVLPNGEVKQILNGTVKNVAMYENVIPRSGGAVITGAFLGRNYNDGELCLSGGTDTMATNLSLFGKDAYPQYGLNGALRMTIRNVSLDQLKLMHLYPSGTWTWDGTACQITSDQRYKQQIKSIDDDLLTAWEDVNPVQFKYNDAVEQKSDNARLHTGYVVQQIDDACKSHGVDVSKYGLYCHEEYAEETREVEHEDGTKTTEVVRPASEHYSLRYTEALIVECAYLRKCIKELRTEIEQLKSSKLSSK